MNKYMRIALNKAARIIQNPDKAINTIERALKKSNKVEDKDTLIQQLKTNVQLFFQMMYDFIRGRYKSLPISSAIKVLGALIYFLFLVDAVPDFLVGIGLLDDAAVLAWVVTSISGDIAQYKAWKNKDNPENNHGRIIPIT